MATLGIKDGAGATQQLSGATNPADSGFMGKHVLADPSTGAGMRVAALDADARTPAGTDYAASTASVVYTFNGTTYDRLRSGVGDGATSVGVLSSAPLLFNGTTYDRARSVAGDGQASTGIGAMALMLFNGTNYDRVMGKNGAVSVLAAQASLTDRSAASLTTANVSQQLMAANTARRYLVIQNRSTAASVFINFGAAASSGSGSFELTPGQSFTMEGLAVSTDQINWTASTTAAVVSAKEM